jgi:uncharacterized protein YyaL (SSP411 family)
MNEHSDYTNHLAGETSPYLLQHAHNPVDWYPWGPEALDRARDEHKPILLSVGYSACHWCHVMAHESFENPQTAALMNALFVNIKVDREERPDLDRIYQGAHSLLAQRPGGWPLTVFLTPDDRVPFFAGTYFPDSPRHGLPAFRELLQRVHDFLREHEPDIRDQNRRLLEAMGQMNQAQGAETLDSLPLDAARQALEKGFDHQDGGFGRAPKFPHPTSLERLLRHWAAARGGDGPGDPRALHMVAFTLEKMAHGGLFDQLGGGFCRYSVDDQWMIPHFEKMLYDNGPLLALYAQAWAATGNELFARTARATAGWVLREMQSPDGGYYSSLDADSAGEEGKYYVWDRQQVRALLDDAQYSLVARRYGLDRAPNFEGHWHLHVYRTVTELARETGQDTDTVRHTLAAAHAILLQARAQRVRPGRDEKILTSWNALMIRGLAIAARHLDADAWLASAQRALDFIRTTLWRDGRLLATCKDGHAHLNAYLDDYVYLIDALLELLQVRWCREDLDFAIELAEVVLARFGDPAGGFFFTSDDHETLIQRVRPDHDDAMPGGNGIAAQVLGRLGHLLGEPRYLAAAEATLKSAWQGMRSMPHGHTSLLVALEESLFPIQTVILRGTAQELPAWRAVAARPYAPARLTLAIPAEVHDLPGALAQRTAGAACVAYVCAGTRCGLPVTSLQELQAALS